MIIFLIFFLLGIITSGGSRGGQGGALPPLKKFSTIFLLSVITINTVSLTFCPLRKRLLKTCKMKIINEFAANEKNRHIALF